MAKKRTKATKRTMAKASQKGKSKVEVFDQLVASVITLGASDPSGHRVGVSFRWYPKDQYGALELKATNERPSDVIVLHMNELEAFGAAVTEVARIAKAGTPGISALG